MKQEKKQKSNKTEKRVMKDKNRNLVELYNKGKVHYVLKHGVLSWGISTGIIFVILTSLFQYGFSFREITDNFFTINSLLAIAIFAAAGLIWGQIMWKVITKQVEGMNPKKKK
ncbi:hypothetical protein SAMN05660297_00940 [Natronincola peptidivorans]|uniref:Uncharacterized protein n=1 Tax=Natronincola peptidivorans TaxID=426128 RepID=A0A1I0AIT4_9FIRM|nr:hypothetical protein [Natronincola peptidivorans]SES94106.1 hypothetical protein SAMN05660297_00940 [Natronincola peptidivorans]